MRSVMELFVMGRVHAGFRSGFQARLQGAAKHGRRIGLAVIGLAMLTTLSSPASAYDGQYKLLGRVWNADNGPIEYAIHPDGSDDVTDGSDFEAIRGAFRSWACVPGQRLRFLESTEPGPAVAEPSDGVNTIFWDENGSFGLGIATLGVTISIQSPPDGQVIQPGADIIFNGFDHEWRAGPGLNDIESVAVHEVGHALGLDHPCDLNGGGEEENCLGPDESVMTPALPSGEVIRTPTANDVAGILALYPQDENDESRCDGPFRQGEPCACNDECISGNKCTLGDGQPVPVCTPNCGSSSASCPTGFSCVLAARPEGQDLAEGACVADTADGKHRPAAACERDSDCEVGLCLATTVVGRRICQVSCDNPSDCPADYDCTSGICTGGGASGGIMCPLVDGGDGMPDGPCMCQTPSSEVPWGALALGVPAWFVFVRRRRTRQA